MSECVLYHMQFDVFIGTNLKHSNEPAFWGEVSDARVFENRRDVCADYVLKWYKLEKERILRVPLENGEANFIYAELAVDEL